MKKKQISLLLAASFVALSAGACGTKDPAPSKLEITDIPSSDEETAAETKEEDEAQSDAEKTDTENSDSETDASVTNESSSTSGQNTSPVSITIQKTSDEFKADDGGLLFKTDTAMPVVAIEGAEDIAAKINADIEAYYAGFSSVDDELLENLKSDYEASLADEDGEWFIAYSQSVFVDAARMDDKVLSLKITLYDYTGGAHGNSMSIGKNYDLRTGSLISFADLSADASAFQATVLDYMFNLAQTPTYKEKMFDATKEDLNSTLFQEGSLLFTQSGISLLSDPYSLGPYSSGEIVFQLPYEKAYELGLKEDYRYDGNYTQERYYTTQYDPDTMEQKIDGTPEYSFDLNGDGTEEGIAFYGFAYPADSDTGKYFLYIDGTDWGDVIKEAAKNGYLESTYALYDCDPADSLTEIAVLVTEFGEEDAETGITDNHPYTYLFQYTADKELQFIEKLDGYVTKPAL